MSDLTPENRRFLLAAYPQGLPREGDFRLEDAPRPVPAEGEFLVRTRWLSVDPMVRIFISETPMSKGRAPLRLGSVIPGAAIGEVVESHNPAFPVGALLEGRFGWQDYAVSSGAGVRSVDLANGPAEAALGVLGLPGFTAWAGLKVAGDVGPGQTILVSGAAGAVGSAVGPLARARGARVVGLARGEAKRTYLLDELGYDAVVDWSVDGVRQGLETACPDGVDVYFDNVGGPLFAEVLPAMNRHGRVVICGLMAQYNTDNAPTANIGDRLPAALTAIMGRGLTVSAFSNVDHHAHWPAFLAEVGAMVRSGAMPTRTQTIDGLEATPAAFVRLFTESLPGKVLVKP